MLTKIHGKANQTVSAAKPFFEFICFKGMSCNKDKIARIYTSIAPAKASSIKWFMENAFDEEEASVLTKGGNVASLLLMKKYLLQYSGKEAPCSLIYGAVTVPQMRGKGYMSELMTMTLTRSYEQGDVFTAVIPEEDRLYFYYDRFQYSTTVYVDCERYTSIHPFACDTSYVPVSPTYDILAALERERPTTVLHTPRQYDLGIRELTLKGGQIVAAAASDTHKPAAIAIGLPSQDGKELTVKTILATDPQAADCVLAQLRRYFPDKSFSVWAQPGGRRINLNARGMTRIINVEKTLGMLTEAHPGLDTVIRVHDKYIPANNGVFVLHNGQCRRLDSTIRHLSLDVSVNTLGSLLFSSEAVGKVFGLPTARINLQMMP